ncbi:MAG: glucose 1-dehydrogenase [Chloroflexi bacterium]|nr:glucose 1-dehydrogenase [Chloroflexota bacterium]MYK35818.1 glucose 1-dehydrogenase [Chloroflexota bacterium]
MRLQNRTIIVTGSGRNIGEGIAHTLAGEGARVAVVDIIRERAEAVAAAINAAHPDTALPIACDVTNSTNVQEMVARVVDVWGNIYGLVNNVGVVDRKDILETDEAEWDRVINVSLKSVFLVSKYVAHCMVDQGRGGRIINIGSTSGLAGRTGAVAYPSAKAGVYNLSRSLAIQLAPHGIRVNTVTPNRILTEAEPGAPPRTWQVTNLVGRQGTPQDVAAAVAFLASDEADFITGSDITVDGGVRAG